MTKDIAGKADIYYNDKDSRMRFCTKEWAYEDK